MPVTSEDARIIDRHARNMERHMSNIREAGQLSPDEQEELLRNMRITMKRLLGVSTQQMPALANTRLAFHTGVIQATAIIVQGYPDDEVEGRDDVAITMSLDYSTNVSIFSVSVCGTGYDSFPDYNLSSLNEGRPMMIREIRNRLREALSLRPDTPGPLDRTTINTEQVIASVPRSDIVYWLDMQGG